jgi:hypothetical protein
MSNMQTILTHSAQEEIREKYVDRKLEYKVNHSMSWGLIRERLLDLFTNNKDVEKITEELKVLFVEHIIPVRPGRSNERDVDKYRQRTKPKQFKNRRQIT